VKAGRLIAAAIVIAAGSIAEGAFDPATGLGGVVRVPVAPGLLSQTGLYTADGNRQTADGIGAQNRPFSPQYPLCSDGATKRRWVYLPGGSTIDTTDVDAWDFPVGTKFWKEFQFAGRRVETRFLWRATADGWVFASYVWNDEQTDAVRAPEDGVPNVVAVAPGRYHSIPSVADCRSCHDSARTEILGFDALQLSNDRDPNAPHAEALTSAMITLRALVDEGRLRPSRPEWAATPPQIAADDPQTRAALGYLSVNCGNCHNRQSSIASLGLVLKHSLKANAECTPALATSLGRSGHWVVPDAPDGESKLINSGHPELSAIVHRAKSRRPSSQMPPFGTVVADKEAVGLLTNWVRDDPAKWAERALKCARAGS
jgi:hypothetical protein